MRHTEILERLVAFPTVSRRDNRALVDFVCELLDRPGVRFERYADAAGHINLLVRIGPDTDAQRGGLVLCGHVDVVPAGGTGWRSDPFELTASDDGMLAARGSADMKGFIAVALAVARQVDPASLRHPLCLLLTRDEEVGTVGARDFVNEIAAPDSLPRATIVGEPTSLEVVRAHKGHLQLEIDLTGRSAHSGYPHLGVNAIELAGRAVRALGELRCALEAERPDSAALFEEVPFVPLNVGLIRGGAALNVVPARCQVGIGLRPMPGVSADSLQERVGEALAAALPEGTFTLRRTGESPPLLADEQAPIHRCLVETMGQEGHRAVSYATDAGWLQQLDLDCVVWGPGDIAVAHRPNEAVPVDELARCERLLAPIVARFCEGA